MLHRDLSCPHLRPQPVGELGNRGVRLIDSHNQRPELFAAAVANVPSLMVATMNNRTAPDHRGGGVRVIRMGDMKTTVA